MPGPADLVPSLEGREPTFLRGQDVYAVQHALVAAGFSPGVVDGTYGHATEAAVRAFQTARGLPATGVVCGQTYISLNVGCSSVPACPGGIVCRVLRVTRPNMSGPDVLAVQQALASRGFSPGPLDGIYGPRTAAAVRAFQAANGLPVTGITCGQTYVLLGVTCHTVPPCPPEPGACRVLVTSDPFMSGSDVLAGQQALLSQGFSPGALDGVYGPLTATAVRNFQMSRGILATGVVCDGLYSTLGITCSNVPPCPVGRRRRPDRPGQPWLRPGRGGWNLRSEHSRRREGLPSRRRPTGDRHRLHAGVQGFDSELREFPALLAG